jgi:hypothetical protein
VDSDKAVLNSSWVNIGTPISYQQSAISNQQSAISNQQSAANYNRASVQLVSISACQQAKRLKPLL